MYIVQAYGTEPFVLAETEDYAVVYKPPFIHSVPLKKAEGEKPLPGFPTLLDWYGRIRKEALEVSGRKECEGGLLHRLDYETEGLVLIAKNQGAMDAILARQEQGFFIKEYGAVSSSPGAACSPLPGFPPFPQDSGRSVPSPIKSYFRPWGPGRRAVRPVVTEPGLLREKQRRNIAADQGKPYITEVLETEHLGENFVYFKVRIKRGFRHQIRCHLSWIGRPILNDGLYGGMILHGGAVALRAEGFSFYDPASGEKREYRIPPLSAPAISR
ncbi:RNA pseudouridine synthase [Spirochaetia bacterium]|nr:RNA pseudouridine synthase [Spirochaetia bacterium]